MAELHQPTELDLLRAALAFQTYFDSTPVLSPGHGPQNCPAPLPVMTGVIGTVEFGNADQYVAQIFFEPLPQEESEPFMQAVNAELVKLGWRLPETKALILPPSGFLAVTPEPLPAEFAQEEFPPFTYLYDEARLATTWDTCVASEGQLAVKLNIQAGMSYSHYAQTQPHELMPTLPVLLPPADLLVMPLTGGGNGGPWGGILSAYALVRGTGSTRAVTEHYGQQLENAGWKKLAQATSDQLQSSRWQTPAGDTALLSVETITDGEAGEWQVGLQLTHMETRPDGEMGSSWFTIAATDDA